MTSNHLPKDSVTYVSKEAINILVALRREAVVNAKNVLAFAWLRSWLQLRVRVNVTGVVQGVGFRPFVYHIAVGNGLKGYVRNRGDAGVEILLEGVEPAIQKFMIELKEKKPPLVQIYRIIKTELPGEEGHEGFSISSSSNEGSFSGSVIPPDIAICEDCLMELGDPSNLRFDYFFITCTNCGPRFTIIDKVPYDRENTTMRDFAMCKSCRNEYADPLNRRFNAQTIACPKCGPKAYLTTSKGEPLEAKDPIRKAGRLLSEGCILAVKGYGGFHVAATAIKDEPIARLREIKHRSQKPFAIMARDLGTTKSFARLNQQEARLLSSYSRPIVLLNKNGNYYLSPLIAPHLHDIGVMLPYTGLHYMLFDEVNDPAFIMTSANPPNQPIIKDDEEAVKTLGDTVDYFLLHNRRIAHRCDDSVIRLHSRKSCFIRRSRGYAPEPIRLKKKARVCAVGLGGELSNTACVLNGDKAFISQHIGDVENVETRDLLKDTARHLIQLTNGRVETIVCDLHPKFTTTALARQLAEENEWQLVQVQHHYAHIAGLMAEHDVNEMIGICCDGYGYGTDGEAWGGEILLCTRETPSFKRLAHLEKQPLLGGDLATRYPLRMAAGILAKKVDVENWLLENQRHFPHGKTEVQLILDQLRRNSDLVETTSCGRVLDAVAAVLGLCFERTYEGEPAMKLESVALGGRDVLRLEPVIESNTLKTTQLLHCMLEKRERCNPADLAYSAHAYLAKGLVRLAIENAQASDIGFIGFSGGVACNKILALRMRRTVEASGLSFLVNESVPPGDGGVSFGQTASVGFFAN